MSEPWIREFLSLIGDADINALDLEKAFALKNKHLPMALYKFRAVNKFSLDNLREGTVWVTSPSKYNDPYDCAATLSFSEIAKAAPHVVEYVLRHMGEKAGICSTEIEHALRSDDPLAAISILPKCSGSTPSRNSEASYQTGRSFYEDVRDTILLPWRTLLDEARDSVAICSFCATNLPLLMWSHYADNHRGFCMEYSVISLPEMIRHSLYPVIYSTSLFDCSAMFLQAVRDKYSFNPFLLSLLPPLHKAKQWEYEMEWRLSFPSGSFKPDRNLEVGLPKTVYLGAKMPSVERETVIAICREMGIDIRAMRLASERFELISEPVS